MIETKRYSITLPLLFLSMLLSACHSAPEQEVKPEVPVQMVTVTTHDLAEHITADAVLWPKQEAAITPKVVAPVAKWYVQRGDRVHKGELLAVLENKDIAAAAQENKGALEQAQAGYQTSTQATIPEEVTKAESDVAQAKQNLDANTLLVESRRKLFKEGALARKDLDTAEVAYVQAKAQYQIAEQHLKALQAGGREQAIAAAKGQLTAAQGKYAGSEAQLSYTEVRSPIDGIVTERPPYVGETPAPGTPLLTVMDMDTIISKAHIPQTAAQQLHVGASATISVNGAEKPVAGKVTLISPALDPNSTTVEIWVSAPNKSGALRPGSPAQVNIDARTAKNALAVPTDAIVESDGHSQVMVVSSGSIAHATDVQTGIADTEQKLTQITSGLKAGERVVTVGAYGLPDGAKAVPAGQASDAGGAE
jgi:HlyD family secretion protein